jgi:DNA-binding CsgD family transcriptional regulator
MEALTRQQLEDDIAECAGPPRPEVMARCYPSWFTSRAWELLDLPDWAALCRLKLGHLKLGRQEDRLIVEIACWEVGMTNVDIAVALNVNEGTVRNDSALSETSESAVDKRDKLGRPVPTKSQVAQRRLDVARMTSEGVGVADMANTLGTTERTIRADLAKLAGKPRVRKSRSTPPVEEPRRPVGYKDSAIVRSILASAVRTVDEDWVKAIASLADSAETDGNSKWFDEMDEAVNTLWSVYGRVQRLLRDKDYREHVISSHEERDSSFANTSQRRAKLAVALQAAN